MGYYIPRNIDTKAAIVPYADHATNEQFHTLEALAYIILRMIGQQTLLAPDAPPRYGAKRRIQEIMTLAAHCVCHAR